MVFFRAEIHNSLLLSFTGLSISSIVKKAANFGRKPRKPGAVVVMFMICPLKCGLYIIDLHTVYLSAGPIFIVIDSSLTKLKENFQFLMIYYALVKSSGNDGKYHIMEL